MERHEVPPWAENRPCRAMGKEISGGPCRRVLQHATPGRVKARRIGRCVRTSSRRRTNPRTGMFGGCASHAERAAAHHPRGQSAAGWSFASAGRLAGPMLCVVQGRLKKRCHQGAAAWLHPRQGPVHAMWWVGGHDADIDAKSALVRSDPLWSALVRSLVRSGPLWSILVHSGPFWSILVHPGPSWSILVHPGPS